MRSLFAVLALSLSTLAFANEAHEVKGAVIKSYDATHHDIVITADGHDVHLHTEHATLHGTPEAGKHADVSYEGDQAKEVTVH